MQSGKNPSIPKQENELLSHQPALANENFEFNESYVDELVQGMTAAEDQFLNVLTEAQEVDEYASETSNSALSQAGILRDQFRQLQEIVVGDSIPLQCADLLDSQLQGLTELKKASEALLAGDEGSLSREEVQQMIPLMAILNLNLSILYGYEVETRRKPNLVKAMTCALEAAKDFEVNGEDIVPLIRFQVQENFCAKRMLIMAHFKAEEIILRDDILSLEAAAKIHNGILPFEYQDRFSAIFKRVKNLNQFCDNIITHSAYNFLEFVTSKAPGLRYYNSIFNLTLSKLQRFNIDQVQESDSITAFKYVLNAAKFVSPADCIQQKQAQEQVREHFEKCIKELVETYEYDETNKELVELLHDIESITIDTFLNKKCEKSGELLFTLYQWQMKPALAFYCACLLLIESPIKYSRPQGLFTKSIACIDTLPESIKLKTANLPFLCRLGGAETLHIAQIKYLLIYLANSIEAKFPHRTKTNLAHLNKNYLVEITKRLNTSSQALLIQITHILGENVKALSGGVRPTSFPTTYLQYENLILASETLPDYRGLSFNCLGQYYMAQSTKGDAKYNIDIATICFINTLKCEVALFELTDPFIHAAIGRYFEWQMAEKDENLKPASQYFSDKKVELAERLENKKNNDARNKLFVLALSEYWNAFFYGNHQESIPEIIKLYSSGLHGEKKSFSNSWKRLNEVLVELEEHKTISANSLKIIDGVIRETSIICCDFYSYVQPGLAHFFLNQPYTLGQKHQDSLAKAKQIMTELVIRLDQLSKNVHAPALLQLHLQKVSAELSEQVKGMHKSSLEKSQPKKRKKRKKATGAKISEKIALVQPKPPVTILQPNEFKAKQSIGVNTTPRNKKNIVTKTTKPTTAKKTNKKSNSTMLYEALSRPASVNKNQQPHAMVEAGKIATIKVDEEKLKVEKIEAQRVAAVKVDEERLKVQRAEVHRLAAVKAEVEKLKARSAETQIMTILKADVENIIPAEVWTEEPEHIHPVSETVITPLQKSTENISKSLALDGLQPANLEKAGFKPFRLHPIAIEIIQWIKAQGYECYAVGGVVWRYLIGDEIPSDLLNVDHDFDFVTSMPMAEIEMLFGKRENKYGDNLCRYHRYRGVEIQIDITFNPAANMTDIKKDYTIRALFADVSNVYDPTGRGLSDLLAHRVQLTSNTLACFEEDAFRILSGLKLLAHLTPPGQPFNTSINWKEFFDLLDTQNIPLARIAQKVVEQLSHANVAANLITFAKTGFLKHFLPDLIQDRKTLNWLTSQIQMANILKKEQQQQQEYKYSCHRNHHENIILLFVAASIKPLAEPTSDDIVYYATLIKIHLQKTPLFREVFTNPSESLISRIRDMFACRLSTVADEVGAPSPSTMQPILGDRFFNTRRQRPHCGSKPEKISQSTHVTTNISHGQTLFKQSKSQQMNSIVAQQYSLVNSSRRSTSGSQNE